VGCAKGFLGFLGIRKLLLEWKTSPLEAIARRCRFSVPPLLALTVAGDLGNYHLLLELCSHFKAFYLGASLFVTLFLLLFRQWVWSGLGAICIGLNLWVIVPWYLPDPSSIPIEGGISLRVMYANVLTKNENKQGFISRVREAEPDILVVLETDQDWLKALEVFRDKYPATLSKARSDDFGIAVFSAFPFTDAAVTTVGGVEVPAITATIEIGDREIFLLALHTFPPKIARWDSHRMKQIEAIPEMIRDRTQPCLVIADLNAAMWSPYYKQLIGNTGLRNTRKGFGLLPTWPAYYSPFLIPIDHILCTPDIQVLHCEKGKQFGSDHLPLIADLVIPGS